jgi:hypothetical protein
VERGCDAWVSSARAQHCSGTSLEPCISRASARSPRTPDQLGAELLWLPSPSGSRFRRDKLPRTAERDRCGFTHQGRLAGRTQRTACACSTANAAQTDAPTQGSARWTRRTRPRQNAYWGAPDGLGDTGASRRSANFKPEGPRHPRRHPEGSGRLVGPLVFKTSVPVKSWQAGSIPVPLREPIGVRIPGGMKYGWMHARDSTTISSTSSQRFDLPAHPLHAYAV